MIGYHTSKACGFHRDDMRFTNHDQRKHISEAPVEWLPFLLSPAKLTVAGHDVEITAEGARIGCTNVTREEVKRVYEALCGN